MAAFSLSHSLTILSPSTIKLLCSLRYFWCVNDRIYLFCAFDNIEYKAILIGLTYYMSSRTSVYSIKTFFVLITLLVIICSACNTTKLVKDKQYLLRGNTIKLKSDKPITRKSELKNNL